MSSIDLDILINTSFAILLLSYIMKDILWLRILTVISLSIEMPYFYFLSEPLWDVMSWLTAFLLINIYWIARLLFDRRPVRFTNEQKHLWRTAFHRVTPRHARKLFKIATHRSVAPGQIIVREGETLDEIAIVLEGLLDVRLNRESIEQIRAGHFIGSAMFLERELDMASLTTIVAVEETRILTWKKTELRSITEQDHQFSTAIEATLGLDIAYLLINAWNREALANKDG